MTYKAIIFDVGDTLLAHYPTQAQIHTDRMRSLGFPVEDRAANEIASAIEKAAHEQIAREQNGAPRMPDEDFNLMLDRAALGCVVSEQDDGPYMEKLRSMPLPEQELRIIPGTVETLTALKKRGFRLAIVSNHREWLPVYLREIGLADFFETIIVSDIVGVEKPDARIMEIALDRLSLPAPECLYVGDHPFDVFCAKKAGMACAWLAAANSALPESVQHREDFRIGSLGELLDFVGQDRVTAYGANHYS